MVGSFRLYNNNTHLSDTDLETNRRWTYSTLNNLLVVLVVTSLVYLCSCSYMVDTGRWIPAPAPVIVSITLLLTQVFSASIRCVLCFIGEVLTVPQ